MFAATLSIFAAYSFAPGNFKVGNIEIKRSKIASLFDPPIIPDAMAAQSMEDSVHTAKVEKDTTAQRILIIGDSMVEGIMWRLKSYCLFNGHDLKPVIWYSSSTKWYGEYDTLAYFINEYNPTYIMLVIGGNELFIPDIIEQRSPYVQRIQEMIGDKKYIWIGPPNWKKDTGINDLILKHVGEGRYFPSKNLTYKRLRDGAHPTRESASMWMDSIASWIENKSLYPIRLSIPDTVYKVTPKATLLQPLK